MRKKKAVSFSALNDPLYCDFFCPIVARSRERAEHSQLTPNFYTAVTIVATTRTRFRIGLPTADDMSIFEGN